MSFYYHPEEEHQYGVVIDYKHAHPDARYLVEFGDGEAYKCAYADAYESENGGELDIEMDDPRYDEFHQVVFEVTEVVQRGRRPYNEWLSLDYRDWPAKITDVDTGTVVYPASWGAASAG
ncbi:MAG: hypothetical protein WCF12_14305 [Propionicimonas sp.]